MVISLFLTVFMQKSVFYFFLLLLGDYLQNLNWNWLRTEYKSSLHEYAETYLHTNK